MGGDVVPPPPPGVCRVRETAVTGAEADRDALRLYSHDGWRADMPWLLNGITAGPDMSLFGSSPAGDVVPRWLRLQRDLGCTTIVHAHQVHEADVAIHDVVASGVLVAGAADGHATARAGVLLAVSVADCVPIFVVAPDARAVALLHGGWRGVVAGIFEAGVSALLRISGSTPGRLRVHFGPAICGACFEVGPEVPARLGLVPVAAERSFVDLRAVLAERAIDLGVPTEQVTISSFCTRCGDSPFFSHRAGCRERQVALLGVHDT